MIRVLKPQCFFCGTTEGVAYCPACKAYLCPEHRKDYPRRAAHGVAHPIDTGKKLLDFLAGR